MPESESSVALPMHKIGILDIARRSPAVPKQPRQTKANKYYSKPQNSTCVPYQHRSSSSDMIKKNFGYLSHRLQINTSLSETLFVPYSKLYAKLLRTPTCGQADI
eukprot:Blabericola_migrator_1__1522@NODE_13_length_24280_cov_225_960393_g10_i0_p16_GENE_NODE_13_length_24280_cov_225_960393_g10_i0NODE_13_length_24280_cov_225_960393_g10_i0_p16_ORF_typecomplete_len105_score0_69_NODE_13_length_24280_cov_225_960393_g10_i01158411898